MTYVKRIFCLANSRKTSGRCVAGKEVDGRALGAWVRPISNRPTHEISEEDRSYGDGTRAQVLDVIDIWMIQPRPTAHQIENHLIDDSQYWTRVAQGEWAHLEAALDPVSPLWVNGYSTYHGGNDKVPEAMLAACGSSLRLIDVAALSIVVVRESEYQSVNTKKRVRAVFDYAGVSHSLVVTDPVVEDEFMPKEEGKYAVGRGIVCVSLGEVKFGHGSLPLHYMHHDTNVFKGNLGRWRAEWRETYRTPAWVPDGTPRFGASAGTDGEFMQHAPGLRLLDGAIGRVL